MTARWEHFQHQADMGVRGYGDTPAAAFEQAALAMTAVITDPDAVVRCREVDQPVLVGGTMGTSSYILAGTRESAGHAFSSACHGAGRAMSRRQATRTWNGRDVVDELEDRGVLVRSPSLRGIAEEAPGAYKDVSAVVDVTDRAGLARLVVQLKPVVCIKG